MLKKAHFLVLGLGAAGLVVLIGCVGDEPAVTAGRPVDDAGTAPEGSTGLGGENGPCYPNQTCDPMLQCVSGVCRKLTSDGGPCVVGTSQLGNCTLGH